MWNRAELRPGRTYILDDFSVIQVVHVADGRVRYRVRAWSWTWHRRVALRRTRLVRLARCIRAEVNGDFFPDIALSELHRFKRPQAETESLDAYLAAQAARRPFAGGR